MPGPEKRKKQLTVRYNPYLKEKNLINMAKYELKKIYKKMKNKIKDDNFDIDNELLELDSKDKIFKNLFLTSLYCSYYHLIKNEYIIDDSKLEFPVNSTCKIKNGFVILDNNLIHIDILKHILQQSTHYFNTDANKILEITKEMLHDINVVYSPLTD
tara:strand:- start:934 stop:1404 length:471 start_codon:yes stop_codon:yes gene_type:complete